MALNIELSKKFKQDDVPLLDRLLAAKAMFLHSEFRCIRKEELVLDWLLELTKDELKLDVWLIIRDCLQSKHMKTLKIIDIGTETKEALVKRLTLYLEAELHGKNQKKMALLHIAVDDYPKESELLLECSLLTLESNVFIFYFLKNSHDYLNLSNIVLKYVSDNADIVSFLRYLKSLMNLYTQCLEKNDFYNHFIEKLFFPIVEVFCSLKDLSAAHNLEEDTMLQAKCFSKEEIKCLRSKIWDLVMQVIFSSFRYKKMTSDLINIFKKDCFDTMTMRILCQFLANNASSQQEVLICLYSLVFEVFVKKSRDSFNIIFQFFVILCSLLGFEVTVQNHELLQNNEICLLTKENISNALNFEILYPGEKVSLLILRELVTTLNTVTWVVNDTINAISFKQWMQGFILKLGTTSSSSFIAYNIIGIIVEKNPLIVTPIVKPILLNFMSQPKETREEKEQYKIFFLAIFNMFFKLNRVYDLIQDYIVPSLRQLIEERRHNNIVLENITASDVIPQEMCVAFESIVGLLPGQISIILLKCFYSLLTEEVLIPMEKGHIDGGHRLFLAVLDKLLTVLLRGVKFADQSIGQTICKKYMEKLIALRTILGKLGIALIQCEPCTKSLASFLHICLATGEGHLLLLLYSPWSSQNDHLQVAQSVDPKSVFSFQCLLSFLSPQHWNDIAQKAIKANDEDCQDTLNALLLQQLRILILFEKSIEHSKELQFTLSEYCAQALGGIQLLQRRGDAAVLVPLLSDEKLLSTAESIVEHLVELDNDVLNLLQDPVLQENKNLILSMAWISMQKIGSVLVKRKRTHNAEDSVPNYRYLVKDMCSSIDFLEVLHFDKFKIRKKFLKFANKINEACKNLLQADEFDANGMPLRIVKLTKYLKILQCLPLPFLSLSMRTFLVLSVLGILIVINEFLKKSRTAGHKKSMEIGDDFMKNEILVNKTSQQILLGLLDGPTHISLFDLVDVDLVIQLLLQDGQCPKPLLQLLFEDCVEKPNHIQKVAEAVCAADKYIEDNISVDIAPNATLLLQMLQSKYLSNIATDRPVYKEAILYLLDGISQFINRRMVLESISEMSAFVLMEAYGILLSSNIKGQKTVVPCLAPHVKIFLSCAFSVLQNPDLHHDCVPAAECLLVAFANTEGITESTVTWDAYKSIDHPLLVAKLLKIAKQEEYIRIMTDLCDSLKPDHLKEFPDLRLPRSLVQIVMTKFKAPYVEQMIVLVSTAAFKKIMQGNSNDRVLDFLSFLLAVASRTKVALPTQLADIILATCVYALREAPISVGFVMTIASIVAQLLSMMMIHHFPLVAQRIPAFLQVYHLVVHVVVINSSVALKLKEEDAENLAKCALQIERLSITLKKKDKEFRAVSQYMIADILQEFAQITVHHKVQVHIMNALYAIIDICDRHAVSHLTFALPPASLELFKTVMSNHRKFYKYTGKV